MFKIYPGLDIPLDGAPKQTICDGPTITQVAVLGAASGFEMEPARRDLGGIERVLYACLPASS